MGARTDHGALVRAIVRFVSVPSCILFAVVFLTVFSHVVFTFEGYRLFTDDAYYYAICARNFAESGRFTFDGIGETNGYHPLLFWIESAIAAIIGTGASPIVFFRALSLFFGAVLVLFAAAFAIRCRDGPRRKERERTCAAMTTALAFCALPAFVCVYLCGMESTLTLPLAVLLFIFLLEERFLSAGLAGAFLVAGRLDGFPFIVIPLVALYSLHRWRARRSFAAAAAVCLRLAAPPVLFVVAWGAFSRIRFGHWMPISGMLKSTFPAVSVKWYNLFGLGSGWLARLSHGPLLVLFFALAGAALLLRRGRLSPRERLLGWAFVVVSLTELASFAFFQKWIKPVPGWYWAVSLFTGSAALAIGIAAHLRVRLVRAAAICVVLLAGVLHATDWARGLYHAASGLRPFGLGWRGEVISFIERTPHEAIWAYTDCGCFSFWSGRRFINLDGLVNDYDYQERLRRGELAEYLGERGVRYLVAGVWDRPQLRRTEPTYRYRAAPACYAGAYDQLAFAVYSYRYETFSDTIMLPMSAEVFRSKTTRDGDAAARWIVYDLLLIDGWPAEEMGEAGAAPEPAGTP